MALLDFLNGGQQSPSGGGLLGDFGLGSNALLQLGAGIAGGETLGDSVSKGLAGLAAGRTADQRQAIFSQVGDVSGAGVQSPRIAQLVNGLIRAGDLDSASKLQTIANAGMTDKIKNFNYGQHNPAFAASLETQDGPKFGLNPVVGVDANGNPAMLQLSDRGGAQPVKLPNGFTISKAPIKVDTATATELVDPITKAPVRVIPKDVAGAAEQTGLGKDIAAAKASLPQIRDASKQMLDTIELIDNHPGKAWSLGKYAMVPTIPGTEQANFRTALAQLHGQTFLQAYNQLRGGGAITEPEGAKGTAAIARLNDAQTPEAFNAAMKDLRSVIKTGLLRANAKANGPSVSSTPAVQTNDPLGLR